MSFFELFKDALALLVKRPKLFLPKLIVALFYSILLLAMSYVLITNSALFVQVAHYKILTPEQLDAMLSITVTILVLFAASIVALVLDIIVNAMYPFLVSDFYDGKELSLSVTFRKAIQNAPRIVPASFGIFLLVSMPLSIAISYISFSSTNIVDQSILASILLLLSGFLTAMVFYFFYPSILLEHDGVLKCIKHNFTLVRKNIRTVVVATIIPFIATLLSFAFAIVSIFAPWFLFVFFAYRLLSACLFTYHMVLNPAIYLEVRSNE